MSPPRLLAVAAALIAGADVLAHATLEVAAARARPLPACPAEDDPPPPWGARAAHVVGEALLALLAVLSLPFALHRTRARPAGVDEPPPVLLVHGHVQRAACRLWLGRRLRRGGRQVASAGYSALADLERGAARVGRALERLRRETGAATVDVVAHGVGGLIVRAYVRARGPAAGIRRLVTLATPHQGTACAWLRLDPGSRLLVGLGRDDPVPRLTDVVAIYSTDDAVVVPATNGYYAGAFNVEVQGLGHAAMLVSRRVAALVRENLDAPPAGPTAGLGGTHG